jgi:hypothetical protein
MITVPSPSPVSTTLDRLLDDELAFSPSFRGVYSNHLAMALVALAQLGAPSDVLESTFLAHAADESEMRDDTADLERMLEEVRRSGITAVVRSRVPTLFDASSTALFHPMIRLAYALDVGHEGQVAAALLDWERRRSSLPIGQIAGGRLRAPDVAERLASVPAGTWRRTFDLDGVARHAQWRGAVQGLAIDESTIDDLSSFAIAAHLAADDFLTLHVVTGSRAVRAVAAVVDETTAVNLVGHSLFDALVVYAAVGAPHLLDARELDDVRRHPLPSPAEIAERAIHDTDPHVIKLANVALVEEERTGDPLYRFAAAHVVGAVPTARDAIR